MLDISPLLKKNREITTGLFMDLESVANYFQEVSSTFSL
jgi:hypothetical protein